MTSTRPEGTDLEALNAGRAFAVLDDYRIVRVQGTDARGWLHDLITCDVASLDSGASRPSLLLTPTGRILASFSVARDEDGYLLFQQDDQPRDVRASLETYTLSSDVRLRDLSNELVITAIIGVEAPTGVASFSPSPIGPGPGCGLLTERGSAAANLVDTLTGDPHSLLQVHADSLEAWRIHRGIPRMGRDFGTDSLPAEAGLEGAIDLTKGCFLGQESVAKVRNFGHPPRVLRHLRADIGVPAGTSVIPASDGTDATGVVTSSTPTPDGCVLLARVPWSMARLKLRTLDDVHLRAADSPLD
jgi:folate-binding protein YgfZ